MIALTRLNNERFVLNADLIRTIEQHADTIVTLTNGERMVVLETSDEVVRKTIEYGRHLRRLTPVD